jgi:iron complex outermembrane receptor protein
MRTTPRTLCLTAVFALAVSRSAAAQERPLDELTLEELMNIEVTTVARAPDLAWRVPAAVYVITREAIERSGATSLPDALRLAPGMQIARIDASSRYPSQDRTSITTTIPSGRATKAPTSRSSAPSSWG